MAFAIRHTTGIVCVVADKATRRHKPGDFQLLIPDTAALLYG